MTDSNDISKLVIDGMFISGKNDIIDEKVENDKKLTLDKYKHYKQKGTIIRGRVVRADNLGNLYLDLGGNIVGIVVNEEVLGEQYNPRKRSRFVNEVMPLIVLEVKDDTNEVYLSKYRARKKGKSILRNKILESLKKKEQIKIKGKVTKITAKKHVLVDLGGVGLLGYIPIKQWEHKFTYDVDNIPLYSIVTVVPCRYNPPKNGYGEMFVCSRKDALLNPWIGIEEKIPKNSILVVKCMDIQSNKWFGHLPGLDLDVYCEFPKEELDMQIKLGHKYKVIVYNVSEETKLLKARPIDIAD